MLLTIRLDAYYYRKTPIKTTKPIGYSCLSLTSAQRVINTTQRECLAVVWAVQLRLPYLENQRFTIRQYHDSLKWIPDLSDACRRLARWRLQLFELEFDVALRSGSLHQAAGAPWGLRTDGEETNDIDDNPLLYNVENTQVTEDEIPYVYDCMDCDVVTKPVMSKPDEDTIEIEETRVSMVQPTQRQFSREKVLTIE